MGSKNVAGLYQMGADMQGVPPHWVSYVSVDNIDDVAEQAKLSGGTVLAGPMDVMGSGRMAMLQDPTGAVVALWQAGQHIGADICNEPGALAWNELLTDDPERAIEFYASVFGWGHHTADMGDFDYTAFLVDERSNAGMMKIREEWGEMPSNWSVYFAVDDCDASAENVRSLGGNVVVPPSDIPQVGRFAAVQDPQGAYLTVIQLANPE
jgi:predicted enzyme related to lactoylglutathione lyase